ncbi:MAG TPA: FtsQ-type POTRA domain-containing protein [Candidatus Sulfotelmatobacter sp.]|nr:FtsQ-type POTRA domain-containing protein [Candidatus Sulfotelmatobacter sp.]
MPARTKRKARPRKKLSLRARFFLSLFFLVLIGAGVYLLLALPIWKIQEVAVTGTSLLSGQEIKDLSGIPLEENLFLTSFARTRDNLRKITAIKEFHIFRIPPATVLIRVTERKPIAVIVFKDRSAIIDADGYILNRNPNLTLNIPDLTNLPAISGLDSAEAASGERIDPQVSRLVAEIIVELSHLLGSSQIQLETGGFSRINFLLNDILRVKLGRDEEIPRKMDVFKRLLPVIAGKWDKVEYVDVRYPDDPVIKYK